ncbi:MAG: ArdC-like ssDNA-binding domain-containing protein [Campylobacterota bacterium]
MTKELENKITEIVAKVENMSTGEYLNIINNMARFHNYSFNNKMLLAFQGCNQVASFNKWKELGRSVKKGEKAKTILAPQTKKFKDKDEETGEEVERIAIVGFRPVPVFDIAQTEGEEIERGMTTKAEISLDHVLKAAQTLGTIVEFRPMQFSIGGYVSSNEIVLNSNLSEAENVGTLIHELAHFMLGHTTTEEHLSSSIVEQEAETVTALICAEFGVDRKSEFYLKSWGTGNIVAAMQKMSKAYAEIRKALEA